MAFGWDDAIMAILGGLSLFGSSTPKPHPFTGSVAPQALMEQGVQKANDLQGMLTDRLKKGVQLRSSYVQTPPMMSGGGLPMNIGVTGRDPALNDPSLLSLPGIDMSMLGSGGLPAGTGGGPNGDPNVGQPGNEPVPPGQTAPEPIGEAPPYPDTPPDANVPPDYDHGGTSSTTPPSPGDVANLPEPKYPGNPNNMNPLDEARTALRLLHASAGGAR